MIVFKNFLRILWRYRITIGTYLFIFMIISVLSGKQQQGQTQIFQERRAEIGIIDESQTELSGHFVKYMLSRNEETAIKSKSEIEDYLINGVLDAVLVIPPNFAENPKENVVEVQRSSFSQGAHKVVQEVSGYMYLMLSAIKTDGSIDYERLDKALKQKATISLIDGGKEKQSQAEWFKRYMNAGSYPVIAVIVLAIGVVMADFNAPKIAFRNKCGGKTLRDFQMGLFLGQVVFGVLVWFLILLTGLVIQGGYIENIQFELYALNLAVFVITILAFAYFINSFIHNKNTLNAIANIFSLGSSFITGAFVPLEYLGVFVKKIAHFLPAYYYVLGNEAIYLQNGGLYGNMAIQLLFALAFLIVGTYFVKIKQKEAALEL